MFNFVIIFKCVRSGTGKSSDPPIIRIVISFSWIGTCLFVAFRACEVSFFILVGVNVVNGVNVVHGKLNCFCEEVHFM